MKTSLNTKINILMIIVVIVFSVIFGFLDYIHTQEIKTAELNEELYVTADRLSQILQVPIWDLDHENIKNLVLAEMRNKNVQTIIIHNRLTNRILFGKTRNSIGQIMDAKQEPPGNRLRESRKVFYTGKDIAQVNVWGTDRFIQEEVISAAIMQARRTLLLILIVVCDPRLHN